jgi:hypothetical protein
VYEGPPAGPGFAPATLFTVLLIELNLNEMYYDAPSGVFFVMLSICLKPFSFMTSRRQG